MSKYRTVNEAVRPKVHDFVDYEPARSRALWKHEPPPELTADVRTDSALDIMRKIQTRVLGGASIIDTHAAPCTDQTTRADYDTLAKPDIAGAQYVFKYPDYERSIHALRESERSPALRRSLNHSLPSGHRLVALPLGQFGTRIRPNLGEKSARIYQPEDNIPQLRTASGKRLELFTNLAMRMTDPTMVHDIIAKELRVLSNIDVPKDYLVSLKQFAGDAFVRSAVIGDRQYHAVAWHPCNASSVRVDVAPMTSDSYGKNLPVNWQSVRTTVRAIGHLNASFDPYVRQAIKYDEDVLQIGLDIAKDSLSPFVPTTNVLGCIQLLQQNRQDALNDPDRLSLTTTKKILDAQAFREGGLHDMQTYSMIKAEIEAAKLSEYDDFDKMAAATKIRLLLNNAEVSAKSAIIRPALSYKQKAERARDDMDLSVRTNSANIGGITYENFKAVGAASINSIRALLRYSIAISYSTNKKDVRLSCAMYVKQWQMLAGTLRGPDARDKLQSNTVIMALAPRVTTEDVCKMMFTMLPYCSFESFDRFKERLAQRTYSTKEQNHIRVSKNMYELMQYYLKLDCAYHERFIIRKLCGKLIHAGMSDSGLMFAIKRGMGERRSLADIVMEHTKYKVDVWRRNYSAQLELMKMKNAEDGDMDYPQMVEWQQKLSVLRNVEFRNNGGVIEVFIRDSSYSRVFLNSYDQRYNTIARRIMKPEKGKPDTRIGIWKVDEHPWGLPLSDSERILYGAGLKEALLKRLERLDSRYWVVSPITMDEVLRDMLDQLVYGIKTAIEEVDNYAFEELDQERKCYLLALPTTTERELNAKFYFSLADPPKPVSEHQQRILGNANIGNTVAGNIPKTQITRRAFTGMMGGRMGGMGGMGRGRLAMSGFRAAASLFDAPKPTVKYITVRELLAGEDFMLQTSICRWLTTLMSYDITLENSTESLRAGHRATAATRENVLTVMKMEYSAYREAKLRDAAKGDSDDFS
jgi:hypothetical protein